MSGVAFASPIWFAAILPTALVVAAVIRIRRRRRANIAYFTGTVALPTSGSGNASLVWARALAVFGALLVITGLAAPLLPVILESQRANVVLLVDTSGSMTATDVAPSRLSAAQLAGKQFVENLPPDWKAGLVAFAEAPVVITAPTSDRQAVVNGLLSLTATGGTGTGDALKMAVDIGRAGNAERVADSIALGDAFENPSRTVIVMLSDGRPTTGSETAQASAYRAQRLGVPVFTIAFGTDDAEITVLDNAGREQKLKVPPDPQTMQEVASITGGGYFTAVTASELEAVYASVNAKLEAESTNLAPGRPLIAIGLVLLAVSAVLAARHEALP